MNYREKVLQMAGELGWTATEEDGRIFVETTEPAWDQLLWCTRTAMQAGQGYDDQGHLRIAMQSESGDPDPQAWSLASSAVEQKYLGKSYARVRATASGSTDRLRTVLTLNAAGAGKVEPLTPLERGTLHTGPDNSTILCIDEGWGIPNTGARPTLFQGENPLTGTVMWEPKDTVNPIYGLPDWAHDPETATREKKPAGRRAGADNDDKPLFQVPSRGQLLANVTAFIREQQQDADCRVQHRELNLLEVYEAHEKLRGRIDEAAKTFQIPPKLDQDLWDYADEIADAVITRMTQDEMLAVLTGGPTSEDNPTPGKTGSGQEQTYSINTTLDEERSAEAFRALTGREAHGSMTLTVRGNASQRDINLLLGKESPIVNHMGTRAECTQGYESHEIDFPLELALVPTNGCIRENWQARTIEVLAPADTTERYRGREMKQLSPKAAEFLLQLAEIEIAHLDDIDESEITEQASWMGISIDDLATIHD